MKYLFGSQTITEHKLFFVFSICLTLFTFSACSDPVATTDCQAIVATVNCPVGSAPKVHEDLSIEGSCQGGILVDEEGKAQGTCEEQSDCSFICEPIGECLCGRRITADVVECQKCETACGDGVCDIGETGVQGEEGYCPSDCGNVCTPSERRCNGDLRQSCDNAGSWEDLPCPEGVVCQGEGTCPEELFSCTDGITNQDESDVDCGGECFACVVGQRCFAEDDCESSVCSEGRCLSASCGDAVWQEEESDVDCGGECAACAIGRGCFVGSDCTSALCIEGLCLPTKCGDGVLDEGEVCDESENTVGCDFDCTLPLCGDGLVNLSFGESCDDGNTSEEPCEYGVESCSVCGANCEMVPGAASYCGDGDIDTENGEECEDGNSIDDDLCTNTCVFSSCFDGFKNGDESAVDCGGNCAGCDMIRIPLSGPGTTFSMGCVAEDAWCSEDEVIHTVTLDAFEIDPYEVSAAEYAICVNSLGCEPVNTGESFNYLAEGRGNHPVNGTTWEDASMYCIWAGKRLPAEAEWELAAKGELLLRFPWGNDCPASWGSPYCSAPDWTSANAKSNCHETECKDGFLMTSPVGYFSEDVSPYGVYDMGGNLFEWTADWYADYSLAPISNPTGPNIGDHRVLRGGNFNNGGQFTQTSKRAHIDPSDEYNNIGFRCAR